MYSFDHAIYNYIKITHLNGRQSYIIVFIAYIVVPHLQRKCKIIFRMVNSSIKMYLRRGEQYRNYLNSITNRLLFFLNSIFFFTSLSAEGHNLYRIFESHWQINIPSVRKKIWRLYKCTTDIKPTVKCNIQC